MSSNSELIAESIHRRHVSFAAVAATVSVLLHLGLIIWVLVAPYQIPYLRNFLPESTPREPPMRLHDVTPEPPTRVTEPENAPTAGPGGSGPATTDAPEIARLEVPPDAVDVEPPVPEPGSLSADSAAVIREPSAPPAPEAWQPRQEILAVEQKLVRDELAALERVVIPRIERVIEAADVVYPATPQELPQELNDAGKDIPIEAPTLSEILRRVTDVSPHTGVVAPVAPPSAEPAARPFAEAPSQASSSLPIEALLSARITTFLPPRDPANAYFKIEIQRRSESALPVIPKDLLFVQDCSASLDEKRLHFCRESLINSLAMIGPQDRFNVVAFRDSVEHCFSGWTPNSPEARAQATNFVASLRSEGNTDIFTAIRSALSVDTQTGRPVIVLLVSDGYANTGLTDGHAIIRDFTLANNGAVSVFTMGTTDRANLYLLDLLSYSNRGDSRVVKRGRWDIPETFLGLVREVSQPVLSDVRLRVAAATTCEVYPVQTMNLYSDRPLVLYGRYPRSLEHVVFQAAGQAVDVKCDMVFDLNLQSNTLSGDDTLQREWARQKVYFLMSQYARTKDPTLIKAIDETSRMYQISVPHRKEF